MERSAPSTFVLDAFGVAGTPVRLAGGRGTSWLVGNMVFKPLDQSEESLAWQARTLSSIFCDGFRVSYPLRANDGSLVVHGWSAAGAVEGEHGARRWPEIISVGERFHAALIEVPRPRFIDRRTDHWAMGDRVAWGELPANEFAHVKHLPRLAAALRPVAAPSQLIHGDLTGNVLFHDRLPPAIIDLAPYWRPPAYASAIVVGDALTWEGADARLLHAVAHIEDFPQYLLRALIYRAVTDQLFRLDEPIRREDADPYLPAVELACRLAA